MLSPAVVAMSRDAFVIDHCVEITVNLDDHRAARSMSSPSTTSKTAEAGQLLAYRPVPPFRTGGRAQAGRGSVAARPFFLM
jgi:hypothetical protein